jgi:hypothetical protein
MGLENVPRDALQKVVGELNNLRCPAKAAIPYDRTQRLA